MLSAENSLIMNILRLLYQLKNIHIKKSILNSWEFACGLRVYFSSIMKVGCF